MPETESTPSNENSPKLKAKHPYSGESASGLDMAKLDLSPQLNLLRYYFFISKKKIES